MSIRDYGKFESLIKNIMDTYHFTDYFTDMTLDELVDTFTLELVQNINKPFIHDKGNIENNAVMLIGILIEDEEGIIKFIDNLSKVFNKVDKSRGLSNYVFVFFPELKYKYRMMEEIKNNSAEIRKILKCNSQNFFIKYIKFLHGKTEKKFVINVDSRIRSLEYPFGTNNDTDVKDSLSQCFQSRVYTAKLKDIVDIYDYVGDQLFDKNVRYEIEDQLNLYDSIVDTLENNPKDFWFLNNGITLLIEDNKIIDLFNPKSIMIDLISNEKLNFSVINGAQTISTSHAAYFSKNVKRDDDTKVILRVVYPKENMDEKDLTDLINKITIGLNRQKEIKNEDLNYFDDLVVSINELYDPYDMRKFKIVKRGDEVTGNKILLFQFCKLVTAIMGKPGSAKNQSPKIQFEEISQIVEADNEEKNSLTKEMYAKYFNAVVFARNFMIEYEKYRNKKYADFKKSSARDKIKRYSVYYLTAVLVYILNDCQNNDFSNFIYVGFKSYDVDFFKTVIDYFYKLIRQHKLSKSYSLDTFRKDDLFNNIYKLDPDTFAQFREYLMNQAKSIQGFVNLF